MKDEILTLDGAIQSQFNKKSLYDGRKKVNMFRAFYFDQQGNEYSLYLEFDKTIKKFFFPKFISKDILIGLKKLKKIYSTGENRILSIKIRTRVKFFKKTELLK